jgi:hypothetical protein
MRLWTEKEDFKLIFVISNMINAGMKYKDAFVIASEQLERTKSACSNRWYKKAKKLMLKTLDASLEAMKVIQSNQNINVALNKEKTTTVLITKKNKKLPVLV